MKRLICIFFILLVSMFMLNGCEAMGRATARTENNIKKVNNKIVNKIQTADQKFKKGYNSEKQ